ncbi:MAG: VIT domain-containing protein, partial [Rubripirellula sp.]
MTTYVLPRIDQFPSATQQQGFGALRSPHGNLPLQQLSYHAQLVGLSLRTTVVQTFYNPFDEFIEANYIFPLEGEQAVVQCQMVVGDRVVEARLKERGEAREEYRHAIRRGQRAALLEENRSETFSIAVGNIAPGEPIQVRIVTVGQLPVVDGQWTLRLPLVVAPRYVSGIALPGRSVGDGIHHDTDQSPDASCVTPPTLLPGFPSPIDLRLVVDIDPAGLEDDARQEDHAAMGLRQVGATQWLGKLESSLHSVIVESPTSGETESSGCRISINPGERVDRDFILRGRFSEDEMCSSMVYEPPTNSEASESDSGTDGPSLAGTRPDIADATDTDAAETEDRRLGTFAVHFVPPSCSTHTPRDVVFVLDRSGSMAGWKMTAAARGMARLVDTLSPQDRFQVIAFDCERETFSAESPLVEASDKARWAAMQWIGKISARGGTEMAAALEHALQSFRPCGTHNIELENRSRSVVIATDGQITSEDSVMRMIGESDADGTPRIFCLGIDRAVNASVLRRISNRTGGTMELVESEKRLDEVMRRFAIEIGAPTLTNLSIDVGSDQATLQPAPMIRTDVYLGRSLTIYGRLPDEAAKRVTVRGQLADGTPYEETIEASSSSRLATERTQSFLLPLWAKVHLRELEDEYASQSAPEFELREKIVDCSLEAGVLSRFTAFIAVDKEIIRREGRLHPITQPVETPEGGQQPWPIIDSAHRISLRERDADSRADQQRTHSVDANRGTSPPIKPLTGKFAKEFKDELIRSGVISESQWTEACNFGRSTNTDFGDALETLKYADPIEVATARAKTLGVPFIDLRQESIAEDVLEQVPESVARENSVLPLESTTTALTIAMADPTDLETIEKIRFILNRQIHVVLSPKADLLNAMNRHYGQVEGESADCFLQEFTDTAIDFTETEIIAEFARGSEETVFEDEVISFSRSPQIASYQESFDTDADDSDSICLEWGCEPLEEVLPAGPTSPDTHETDHTRQE